MRQNTFFEHAETMGLEVLDTNTFFYRDRFSEVLYRSVLTPNNEEIDAPEANSFVLPLLAIFTRKTNEEVFRYRGYVSTAYQFVGTDELVQRTLESITEVGSPVVTENVLINYEYTRFRIELIVKNKKTISNVGDVFPVIITQNSYNGTQAATLSFGLALQGERYNVFSFKLGEMRQVHLDSSRTRMTYTVSSYVDVFQESIEELIEKSFNSVLTEDQMLATLDLVEKLGKKRRDKISKILEEVPPVKTVDGVPLHSAWGTFLAILRYSSFETNLNAKRLLENIAESILVIPPKMYQVLKELES